MNVEYLMERPINLIDKMLEEGYLKERKKSESFYYIPKKYRDLVGITYSKLSKISTFTRGYLLIDLYLEFSDSWKNLSYTELILIDDLYKYSHYNRNLVLKELLRRGLNPFDFNWVETLLDEDTFKIVRKKLGSINYKYEYLGVTHTIQFDPGGLNYDRLFEIARINQDRYLIPRSHNRYHYMYLGELLIRNFGECIECDSLDTLDDEGLCSRCGETSVLLPYVTKVEELLSSKGDRKDLYLGVELELSYTDDKENTIKKTKKLVKGHSLLKSDGSVPNGFEIVSCPATYHHQILGFKKFFENIPKTLRPEKECGMHVHVDRKSLSQFQIGKINAFINFSGNAVFLKYLSGREPNTFCAVNSAFGEKFSNTFGTNRYYSLNLTKENTIEFRMFSSTIDFSEFKSKLQFVKAIVDYTNPGTLPTKNLKDSQGFLSFSNWLLSERRKVYPELVERVNKFYSQQVSSV